MANRHIPASIHESWHDDFIEVFNTRGIKDIIRTQFKQQCCPIPALVFAPFRVPKDSVKVVIIGQDPYPTNERAMGHAFAVPSEDKMSKSLEFILDELRLEYDQPNLGIDPDNFPPFDVTLKNWRDQGVLLMNSAMSTLEGKIGSHIKQWRPFTQAVINAVDVPICTMGNQAKNFDFTGKIHIPVAHPRAETYRKGIFIGSNVFKNINKHLKTEIQWV